MRNNKKKFAAIGECMIELRHADKQSFAMNFAGDTFNTALYLARYQQQFNVSIEYVTALGNDPYSNMMLARWQQEGVGCQFVQQLPKLLPGLYFIETDATGERRFYYYRSASAARQLFKTPKIKQIWKKLFDFDYLYFSGISLAILDLNSRKQFLRELQRAKQNGVTICFDTNYRPSLWENKSTAKTFTQQALELTDIALLTFADEQKLFGDKTPEKCAKKLHKWGVKEVVLKLGEAGCFVSYQKQQNYLPVTKKVKPVDTTAAGDSFNAAYLGGRIKGLPPLEAGNLGQQLAATVIAHPGAIIPQSAMPTLF